MSPGPDAAPSSMGHLTDGPPWRTSEGEHHELVSFDVLQVRPAGTDDLAAWQLGETAWTDGAADPPRTRHTLSDADESWTGVDDAGSSVAVVGPAGATEEAVTARFLGRSGEVLGTTPVVPWTPAGGAPQLSP